MPDSVSVTVLALFVVYMIGLPGIDKNDVLPMAAPVQAGAAVAVTPLAAELTVFTVTLKTDPSLRLNDMTWPAAERAVTSL